MHRLIPNSNITSQTIKVARRGSAYIKLSDAKSQTETGVGASNIVEKLFGVFANDRFLVVASDVVPSDAVVVDVVEDAEAGLVGAVDVELGVVGLTLLLVARL